MVELGYLALSPPDDRPSEVVGRASDGVPAQDEILRYCHLLAKGVNLGLQPCDILKVEAPKVRRVLRSRCQLRHELIEPSLDDFGDFGRLPGLRVRSCKTKRS